MITLAPRSTHQRRWNRLAQFPGSQLKPVSRAAPEEVPGEGWEGRGAVEDSLWISVAAGWTRCRGESSGPGAERCYRAAMVGREALTLSRLPVRPALRSPGAGAPGSLPSRDGSVLHGEAHLAPLLLPTACFPLLPSTGSIAKQFWSGEFANSYLPLLLSSFI